MMSGIYSITVQDSLIFHCVTPGTFLQYASAGHITKSAEDRCSDAWQQGCRMKSAIR